MSKAILPTYNINTLKETPLSPKDFMADYFAHYINEHKNLHFPHKHSFYHLVYFSQGSGSHSIDFVSFPVQAGQIYFMAPGQVHGWEFETQPEGYIVNFSEQYLHALIANPRYLDQFSFFSGIASEQVINIPTEAKQQVEQVLETIVREAHSQQEGKDDFVRTALVQLFILVNRYTNNNSSSQQSNYNSVLLRNFQKLIEQHYKEKKLTKDYAAMLNVTPNHLNALCKDVTGRPAGELIRDRILLEAKRLLVNAKMTISEIALELDFIDNSYFSKFFKKYEGVSPEAFRKQIIKKL
ncbi:AraC family transcriptional regulator [Segetibacter aerophilus]|uniref:AraC family transcriptional regulator n=1 Tax=Segetibacter aerophilus TaxID=670293 RepID=A0A512BIW7_9BACT|nr:helix-turn-helix transcriptional regulator [Segetibacter aerophilus]GEO11919.1 AraC family transcriptional regulator [Segetibacter aerophilus]